MKFQLKSIGTLVFTAFGKNLVLVAAFQSLEKTSKILVHTASCRCSMEILQAFLLCASIPWDEGYIRRIEEWLAKVLTAHCAREARELRSLPLLGICPRMALQGWPPKTGR